MHEFGLYFHFGWKHIADLKGLDHILFITALCIRYQFSDFKKLLILVTAFTIGHSVTLVLSILRFIHFSTAWIEFLIPLTIVVTAISNLFIKKFTFKSNYPFIYFAALFFGMVHGLGFSNYLRGILGRNQSIFIPLFSFNAGLEAGQVLIVVAILLISFILMNIAKVNRREYLLAVNGGIIALALNMAFQRIPS